MMDNIAEGGVILTFDNGYVGPFRALRRRLGTGGDSWSYLEAAKLALSLSDFAIVTEGFGYLNVASASLQFGRDAEFLNTALYHVDKIICRLLNPRKRAVLSTMISANPGGKDVDSYENAVPAD
jgi:hypothetical protein